LPIVLKEVDPYQRKYQQLLRINAPIPMVLDTINVEILVESADDFYDYAFYRFTLKHNGNLYILDSSKDSSEIEVTLGALAYELVESNFQQKFHKEGNFTRIDEDALVSISQIKDFLVQKVAMQLVAKNYFQQGLNVVPVCAKAPLQKADGSTKEQKPYTGEDPQCIKSIQKGVSAGKLNEAAIRLASYLLNFKGINKGKVWKELIKWNKLNKPSLDETELKSVLEFAEKNQYVYDCNDELLKSHCQGKTKCPLVINNVSISEIIEEEIQKQVEIQLHPLIDYHPNLGLTIGYFLSSCSQILCFIGGSLYAFRFNGARINGQNLKGSKKEDLYNMLFSPELDLELARSMLDENLKSISFKNLNWIYLSPVHRLELLKICKESCNNDGIKKPLKNKVFRDVLSRISYYWWHSYQWRYVVTLWAIGTYFHPIFSFYPLLILQGQRETGKSTLSDILSKICWNPTGRETAVREADLFRTIEGTRGTYICDITRLALGKGTEDVIDVFETGSKKNGVVRRINPETGVPEEYRTYGPKVIAVRYEVPFKEKGITIISEKAPNKNYAKRRAKLLNDPEWSTLIGDLIRAAIYYWPEVVAAYNSVEQTDKLNGRKFNYWAPILAICKVFAPEHYEEILSFAEEEAQKFVVSDKLSEVEEALLIIVTQEVGQTKLFSLKELTEKVQELLPWVSWRTVRSALQNLGIVKSTHDSKLGKSFQIDLDKAREKAKTRNIKIFETEQTVNSKTAHNYYLQLPDYYKEIILAVNKLRDLAKIKRRELKQEIPLRVLGKAYMPIHYKSFEDVVEKIKAIRDWDEVNEGLKQHFGFKLIEKDGEIYIIFPIKVG